MFFILHIKPFLILGIYSKLIYSIVISEISDFSTKKKTSLMSILNNNVSNIEPSGILRKISDHSLDEEPTLVPCFLKLR